jgi:hypothetical protein
MLTMPRRSGNLAPRMPGSSGRTERVSRRVQVRI